MGAEALAVENIDDAFDDKVSNFSVSFRGSSSSDSGVASIGFCGSPKKYQQVLKIKRNGPLKKD